MNMSFDAAKLRRDYLSARLDEADLANDPFEQFRSWLDEAIAANLIEANAMIVATADADGHPSVRTVLLKEISQSGFVFTTSYGSQKGSQIAANHNVSLLFYWPALERQVRVSGRVERVAPEESDALFAKRPLDAQISAVISPQSQAVPNREYLEQRVVDLKASLLAGEGPPRPPNWGGYRVVPDSFEFWQGRKNRLHDRLRYRRDRSGWTIERLAP